MNLSLVTPIALLGLNVRDGLQMKRWRLPASVRKDRPPAFQLLAHSGRVFGWIVDGRTVS